jgi:hypothetical protein
MSQAGINSTASGPVPPQVPTSFTVDKNDTTITTINAFQGTVVPQANVLRLGGDNGIVTNQTAVPGALIIDFQRGSVITVGAVTSTAFSFVLATGQSLTIQVIVVGNDEPDGLTVGGYCTATVKNVAGTASLIGTADIIVNRDPGLPGTTFTVGTTGPSFIVQVTGSVGKTINWTVALPGVVSD